MTRAPHKGETRARRFGTDACIFSSDLRDWDEISLHSFSARLAGIRCRNGARVRDNPAAPCRRGASDAPRRRPPRKAFGAFQIVQHRQALRGQRTDLMLRAYLVQAIVGGVHQAPQGAEDGRVAAMPTFAAPQATPCRGCRRRDRQRITRPPRECRRARLRRRYAPLPRPTAHGSGARARPSARRMNCRTVAGVQRAAAVATALQSLTRWPSQMRSKQVGKASSASAMPSLSKSWPLQDGHVAADGADLLHRYRAYRRYFFETVASKRRGRTEFEPISTTPKGRSRALACAAGMAAVAGKQVPRGSSVDPEWCLVRAMACKSTATA